MFDPKIVRKDFPIFERRVHGDKPLVYLDSANTSQKPRKVLDTLNDFYERHNANIHRAVYELAAESTERYEGARTKLATFLGAPGGSSEIVFTKSCTEAINLVAYAWGRANLREGDEIVISEMEHHSNLIPWQIAAQQAGAKIVALPITDEGLIDMGSLERVITDRTKMVCVAGMGNVLGTINPVREIADAAHAMGALMLVDGAQRTPHLATNVAELGCDFYAFTGHKMLGPTGSGGLWARGELLEAMPPFLGGGEMILEVWLDHATYNQIPHKFEAGTQPFAQAVGLGAAVDYLNELGMDDVRAHEVEIVGYALERLSEIEGLTIHGPKDPSMRGGVVSFWLDDVHPHDLATIVDTEGVCVRAGHHCAQVLMRRLGVPATTRASFYVYNTNEDVDQLVSAIGMARDRFSAGLPF
ncbi:MAG: cysteine desulfurase [Actinobacteria bacterium]|nr:MAG: cysteine desulfurase [Actinomycetota bacterium]